MEGSNQAESNHALEPEILAYMRLWGVIEQSARGMIALAKVGISGGSPNGSEDDVSLPST